MSKISLVIVARNEERTIGKVLAAASPLIDEIILVDSGSTDETKEIAAEFQATIIDQEWLGYADQKNFAIAHASHEWILSLDADEVLSSELVAEIRDLKSSAWLEGYDGYKIPRLLFIGETPIKHGGFYPDAQLRLFRKSKGKFNERLVHERVFVDGHVHLLKHPMYHYSYADVSAFKQSMEKYALLSVEHFLNFGYSSWQISAINEFLHPLWTFFYRYMIRGGFLDGLLGLQLNLIYSNYVWRKIHYLRQSIAKNHQ